MYAATHIRSTAAPGHDWTPEFSLGLPDIDANIMEAAGWQSGMLMGARNRVILGTRGGFGARVRVVGSTRRVSSRGMRKIRERRGVLPSDFERWSTADAALMRHTRHLAPVVTQTPLHNGRAMESTTAHSRFATLGPPSGWGNRMARQDAAAGLLDDMLTKATA